MGFLPHLHHQNKNQILHRYCLTVPVGINCKFTKKRRMHISARKESRKKEASHPLLYYKSAICAKHDNGYIQKAINRGYLRHSCTSSKSVVVADRNGRISILSSGNAVGMTRSSCQVNKAALGENRDLMELRVYSPIISTSFKW